jgi:16S rRNA (cytidine1402-2'-O)-methyltransferase
LVQRAIEQNIHITPIPGPSAAVSALSASGLPSDQFIFIGFLARKRGRRSKQLLTLVDLPWTMVFYESPRRLLGLLNDILQVMGNRPAVLAREMTKRHEEFVRGRLSELLKVLTERSLIKGECTLIVAGRQAAEAVDIDSLKEELTTRLKQKNMTLSETVREVAHITGLPKKKVYAEALNIKQKNLHE